MRFRPVPAAATWFLKLFCSGTEHESVIGDMVEQYQSGHSSHGRCWYWRQVIAIVFLGLYGKAVRRPLAPTNRIPMRQGSALILLIAALVAVLLSDIWPLFLFGTVAGVIVGGLRFLRDGRTEPANSDTSGAQIQMNRRMADPVLYHRGISMQHIPVEGAVGLLFVFATAFIFGVGIRAVREILVVTLPLGILGSGILFYWHKHHPLKIQVLDLHERLERTKRP